MTSLHASHGKTAAVDGQRMLTDEDKKLFKSEIRKANPVEVLTVAKFIEESSLPPGDKSFCMSQIGMRCEKLLRNVAKNMSFSD